MAETYAAQLDRVQTAIKAIEERGQAYEIDGRRLTRGDLKTLYDRERELRRLAARETRGGLRVTSVAPR